MKEKPTKTKEKQSEPLYDYSRILSVWAFIAIGVFFGVPLWWKTTETYRVSLPYDKIEELGGKHLEIVVNIELIVDLEEYYKKENVEALGIELQTKINEYEKLVVTDKYNVSCRSASLDEKSNRENLEIEGFSNYLSKQEKYCEIGTVYIFVLSSSTTFLPKEKLFYITRNRVVFYRSTSDLNKDVTELKEIILGSLVNRMGLQTTIANVIAPHVIQPDKTTMRTLQSSPVYDVTFTLIIPQPHLVKAKWNIESAIEVYFQPMLTKLKDLVKFKVKSQVLYLKSLNVEPKFSNEKQHFYLTDTQLPHILNPIQATLGSYITTNPDVNFVVYVPTVEKSSLYIYDSSGNPSKTNSFLSPRWGGILIYNFGEHQNKTVKNTPLEFEIDPARMMSIFLAQIRLLLGLKSLDSNENIQFAEFDKTALTDWELDYLLRKLTLENVAKSSNTLTSLSQLLAQIDNIVINDQVGSWVSDAVDATFKSISCLKNGHLFQAFISSSQGHVSSEKAFFDPSMLALLYFPNDQKYAVYIPLFLPVCVPIVFSIFYLIKITRVQKQHEKVE